MVGEAGGVPEEFRTWRDPDARGPGIKTNDLEKMCEVVLETGEVCGFVGTAARVGKHKYHCHGMCNPIKAVTLTSQCPGCLGKFKTLRSAKEHASRALKLGRCPVSSKAARPFLDNIEVDKLEERIVCNLCKEELDMT